MRKQNKQNRLMIVGPFRYHQMQKGPSFSLQIAIAWRQKGWPWGTISTTTIKSNLIST
ncbi:conserved hypothetical protein [Ricinus communis]|uniref:Uncharacterized protein n=1 Tax=Ricinus communis TaxID=3988 RepID=B9S3N9_RICCO|nr:conserved hypothetical protein [Ricinus communis]